MTDKTFMVNLAKTVAEAETQVILNMPSWTSNDWLEFWSLVQTLKKEQLTLKDKP